MVTDSSLSGVQKWLNGSKVGKYGSTRTIWVKKIFFFCTIGSSEGIFAIHGNSRRGQLFKGEAQTCFLHREEAGFRFLPNEAVFRSIPFCVKSLWAP